MKKLNYKKEVKPIANELAKRDIKKMQMNGGQSEEIVNHFSAMLYENPSIIYTLLKNGERLAKKKD